MKKTMIIVVLAVAGMAACEKEVGVEDEGTGTRAYSDSTDNAGGFTFTADTAWKDTIFVDF
jgi:hypothetical protein